MEKILTYHLRLGLNQMTVATWPNKTHTYRTSSEKQAQSQALPQILSLRVQGWQCGVNWLDPGMPTVEDEGKIVTMTCLVVLKLDLWLVKFQIWPPWCVLIGRKKCLSHYQESRLLFKERHMWIKLEKLGILIGFGEQSKSWREMKSAFPVVN